MIVYRKTKKGLAMVRTGIGGTQVSFSGMFVLPFAHLLERMDISIKRVRVDRRGKEGLICKDNIRADITVDFFVRVNNTIEDVRQVATTIGCDRASDPEKIKELFDAKFSEALKTVGKQFDFEELYIERESFRDEITKVIGTDLNGYVLDDAAIDFLEQTSINDLNPQNILDAEGIKKITDRTSREKILANQIDQDRIKTITKQNVEAREAVLELEKQQAEAEQKQKREISVITSREEAEAARVHEEQRLRAEQARIVTEEEISIAEENKERQIIVAQKNKQRTDAVETERVERDRQLEVVERDKVTSLADIEKDKAVEKEKREIQEVIKERVMVEKTVVVEQEKIKDTEAFAGAEREKKVAITAAEQRAEEQLVEKVKTAQASKEAEQLKADELYYHEVRKAESSKKAIELEAEETVISAEARETAAGRDSAAKKTLADGRTAEAAAMGLGEAKVLEAKADAYQKQGEAEASVAEKKFLAEAKGIGEKGAAEASADEKKYLAEAEGINKKAEAMKVFNEAGKEHEEFKLRLQKDKEVELAEIEVNEKIAEHQAQVLGAALKNTRVDIVGGNTDFYDRVVGAVSRGKSIDRLMDNSKALTDVKETFFNGNGEYFKAKLKEWTEQFNISSEDIKNLSIAALLARISDQAEGQDKKEVTDLKSLAEKYGISGKKAGEFLDQLFQN
ncbi:MAG: flotillin family protein [Verrucomicrobiota bacterium]